MCKYDLYEYVWCFPWVSRFFTSSCCVYFLQEPSPGHLHFPACGDFCLCPCKCSLFGCTSSFRNDVLHSYSCCKYYAFQNFATLFSVQIFTFCVSLQSFADRALGPASGIMPFMVALSAFGGLSVHIMTSSR